jgi:hypothetical protein
VTPDASTFERDVLDELGRAAGFDAAFLATRGERPPSTRIDTNSTQHLVRVSRETLLGALRNHQPTHPSTSIETHVLLLSADLARHAQPPDAIGPSGAASRSPASTLTAHAALAPDVAPALQPSAHAPFERSALVANPPQSGPGFHVPSAS